jgi:hypothetical protein
MGASIDGEEKKRKKDKDEEALNIKKKKKDRNGKKSFFGCSARSRWVTERIASAWNASPGPIRNQTKENAGSGQACKAISSHRTTGRRKNRDGRRFSCCAPP